MNKDRLVAVTGANGFIGAHVCDGLARNAWSVRSVVREASSAPPGSAEVFSGIDLMNSPDWSGALEGVDTVVHCAGIAHTSFKDEEAARTAFETANHLASSALGRAAVAAGVRRIVFLSSVGVYGPLGPGSVATEEMICRPSELYAQSKLAAELSLTNVCENSGTEIVIVRPPLVYGPRCPGNFARLVKLVRTGLPLPLASLTGQRSFVSVTNLADMIVSACGHRGDASGVFNVADKEHVSLVDIVGAIGAGVGRSVRLWPCPPSVLRRILGLVGRGDVVDKLSDSILVDASRSQRHFGWEPEIRCVVGMRAAARSFVKGDTA